MKYIKNLELYEAAINEAKGKKLVSDLYKMDAQVDYLSDADDKTKKIWKKAGINPDDDNQIILYSYVNSWPETKKLLDKSKIKYKELEDPNSAGESFIVFDVKESIDLNEAKKFKPGDMWSNDFDYDGMLNYALKVNQKTPLKTLQKLRDSATDVNYHTPFANLDNAIDWIKDNGFETSDKEVKDYFKDLKKDIKAEIKLNEESVNEKLTRGLKPLLKLGSTITKKAGEDALIDLSDKFDGLDDEYAGDIASHLDMAIELHQDGYLGDATKKLKQFNKVCKDVLNGKEVGSAFENVTEGTYNSKDHIGSTADGQGANAEIYKKGKGYYVVVSGEVDYDFTAKNDKELLQKLDDNEFDSTDILEVNEATDLNDPVLIAFRATRRELPKFKPAKAKSRRLSFDKYMDLLDAQTDIEQDIKDVAEEMAQTFRDMEQEAEPEGGEMADKYGSIMMKQETEYSKLKAKKEKIDARIEKHRMS